MITKMMFRIVLWIIVAIILTNIACYFLTMASTLYNILGVIVLFETFALGITTKCFTEFKKK